MLRFTLAAPAARVAPSVLARAVRVVPPMPAQVVRLVRVAPSVPVRVERVVRPVRGVPVQAARPVLAVCQALEAQEPAVPEVRQVPEAFAAFSVPGCVTPSTPIQLATLRARPPVKVAPGTVRVRALRFGVSRAGLVRHLGRPSCTIVIPDKKIGSHPF